MSGKAPPKGPRALLGSQPVTSPSSSSASTSAVSQSLAQAPSNGQSQPVKVSGNTSSSFLSSRIGAAPPTGPRSLQGGSQSRLPPQGPKSLANGHSNHINSAPRPPGPMLQSNRSPISIVNGRKRDNSASSSQTVNQSWQSSQPEPNGSPDFFVNGNLNMNGFTSSNETRPPSPALPPEPPAPTGELRHDRAAVHIPILKNRLTSAVESNPPPPPPPPTYDPPPPPPTQPPPPNPPPPLESCSPPPPPPPPVTSPPPSPPPLPPSSLPPPLPPQAASSAFPPPSLPPSPSESRHPLPPPPPSPPLPQVSSPPEPPEPVFEAIVRPPTPPPVDKYRPPSPVHKPSFLPPKPASLPRRPFSPPWPTSSYPKASSSSSSSRYRPSERSEPDPPPKLYNLPPLPAWPPPLSEYPKERNFRTLYDPSVDFLAAPHPHATQVFSTTYPKVRQSYLSVLVEHVRKHGSPQVVQDRIRESKGKSKSALLRFDGEVVGPELADEGMKEEEITVSDPRRGKVSKLPTSFRTYREELFELKYEHDFNSPGPPPPTALLITGINPIANQQSLRHYLQKYGTITSYEPQHHPINGGSLGILYIKFATHDEARKCLDKENGRKGGLPGATKRMNDVVEEWRVVFDGDRSKLESYVTGIKKGIDPSKKLGPSTLTNAGATPSSTTGVGGSSNTPLSGFSSPVPPKKGQTGGASGSQHSQNTHRPPPPHQRSSDSRHQSRPGQDHQLQHPLPLPPKQTDSVTAALRRAAEAEEKKPSASTSQPKASSSTAPARGRNALQTTKYASVADDNEQEGSPMNISRSSSPDHTGLSGGMRKHRDLLPQKQKQKSAADREKEMMEVTKELARSGHDHVKVQGGVQLVALVKDEDVTDFFEGFPVDKVLRDHTGIYITFSTAGAARRAMVLASKQLGFQAVTLSVHPPPVYEEKVEKTCWTLAELVDDARTLILEELKAMLEKDVRDQLVSQELTRVMAEEKSKGPPALAQEILMEKKGLKGLSFKKKKEVVEPPVEEKADEEEVNDETRPKKKRKTEASAAVTKKSRRIIDEEDLESEDDVEAEANVIESDPAATRKRSASEDRQEEEPVKKKAKILEAQTKGKKLSKKAQKALLLAEKVNQVTLPEADVYESPLIEELHPESTPITPSRSPSPVRELKGRRKRPVTPLPSPPPDPYVPDLCEDDEDLYFAKLALSGEPPEVEDIPAPPSSSDIPTFRKHVTGSARTEGYYKITHAEKAAYVAQYQARAATTGVVAPPVVDEPKIQHVESSRSNRANARRRAQGLEEINQVQRAVALSKGETASELTFKFNQLQTRKKHLRFARSPIHDWGLYAMEKISRGEMVIEYVGEIIRAQVAEKREKAYERQGIGSSYLFRIDEDLVVDATKKGNLGRLINHSCDPNCTAKIITISGEKKIVIYAKQDIELGDEITYDYHFPFEQDKIPCLCGSTKCRGYLN